MELLEKDEEYISSLLKQGKKVEAIAFIKNKTGMTLKEAKDYIDKKNIAISEEDEQYLASLINENKKLEAVAFLHKKWGYIFDEKLNMYVPNLPRQKKILKIMLSIFLVLLVTTLISLMFLDRSSDIKMIILRYSVLGIVLFIITLPLVILNIHITENKLKKIENLEVSNQFEVKAFVSNFHLSLHVLLRL